VTSGPGSIDSKVVDKTLRERLWPELKAIGFRRTGRTAWRDRPGAIQTVNVQSFNSYLADAIGATTYSFGVNLGVFYPVVAEHSALGSLINDQSRPSEHHCHARLHMAKGFAQPNTVPTRRWFDPRHRAPDLGPWVDRPDVWYVRPDGSNVDEVVVDAREQILAIGLPWLDRLSDLNEARRAFLEDEETDHSPGIVAEGYSGALGSPARWHAIAALSIALGDADGFEWATEAMAKQEYYRERHADLESLRTSGR